MRLKTNQLPKFRLALKELQKNQCPICQTQIESGKDVLDHDHVTGEIRSVLCRNCNGIEGKIFNLARRGRRDRSPVEFLESIIKYWITHATKSSGVFHPTHKNEDEKREARNRKARARYAKKKKDA